MRLIWYQRYTDGLWNAECSCGATLCGSYDDERSDAEAWHFERADDDRKGGHKYMDCGPKIPTPDPNCTGPFVFR